MSASVMQRLLLVLFGLLLGTAFAGLAYWQYQRGQQKADWLQQAEQARQAAPIALVDALAEDPGEDAFARPVSGVIDLRAQPRLLLDNQQREGRVGVREYALSRPRGSDPDAPWLLLDLGWLPMSAQRELPTLEPLPAHLEARGLLTALPGQGLRLGENPAYSGSPLLLGYLDPVEIGERLGLAVDARLLRLDPALDVGHLRDLDVLPNTLPPERHRGYALQWAGLSAAAFVITFLLWFRSRR